MSLLIIFIQQYAPTTFMSSTHEAIVHLSGLTSGNLISMASWISERVLCINIHMCTFCLCFLEQQFTVTYFSRSREGSQVGYWGQSQGWVSNLRMKWCIHTFMLTLQAWYMLQEESNTHHCLLCHFVLCSRKVYGHGNGGRGPSEVIWWTLLEKSHCISFGQALVWCMCVH